MKFDSIRHLAFRRCLSVFCAATLLTSALVPASLSAQSTTGTISGTVLNQETRAFLEGARVTLVEHNRSVLTDRAGAFAFPSVPAGDHTVATYYTGLQAGRNQVTLVAGQGAVVHVALASDVFDLEKFLVSASAAGDAASLTKQRNADNVVNVVAMDAFGSVADGNIGNFMVRLPGVAGEMENGEVTGIRIRGTPPELSAVNVDGVRAAGAFAGYNTQGDRGAQIDQIPAEFIKEVEVNKASTPDMPADSIGGSINLITKSALGFQKDLLTYRLGVNHNTFRKDLGNFTPNAALSYLARVGEKRNIGMAMSLSYVESEAPRDRAQMERREADGRNTQARTLSNANERTRFGSGLKFDFRLDEATTLSLKLQYNYYMFRSPRTALRTRVLGNRLTADYNVVSRASIEAGAVARTTSGAVANVAPGYTDSYTELLGGEWSQEVSDNPRHGRQFVAEVAGQRNLPGDQTVSFQASYNPSNFVYEFPAFTATMASPIGLAIDTADRTRPNYVQTYGPSIAYGSNLGLYTGSYLAQREYGEEEVMNAKVDYLKEFSGSLPWQFKTGVNWRQQHRTLEARSPIWTYVGADGVAGTNLVNGINDDNLAQFRDALPGYVPFNNSDIWPRVDSLNLSAIQRLFNEKPAYFKPVGTSVSAPANFSEITENVVAAYVQGRVQWRKLTVLSGARFEQTDIDANGQFTDSQRPGTVRATRSSDYHDFFPSVHLRYDIRPDLTARASYSTGAARPNMTDLYPTTTVSYSGADGLGTVTQKDVGLKPQFSDNLDVSLEYYFDPAGVLSVGWFRKDIKDFLSSNQTEIGNGPGNGFGGDYAGFLLNTTTNLGSALIEGWEANYNQQLSMLPAPFNALRLFANYTEQETSGTYKNGAAELVGFVPKTANAGFLFNWRSFEFRAAWKYTGSYLTTYNVNLYQQVRRTPVETFDFNLQYQFNPKFAVFVDVINAFNKWADYYTAHDAQRITISESYGARLNIGITGRF